MESSRKRVLKPGHQYDALFPAITGKDPIVARGVGVDYSVALVERVAREYVGDIVLLAPKLTGRNLRETLEKIWHFVYDHIQYERDKPGVEQVRRPARSWHDRKAGVDCDCYTTFISSILFHLGIPHAYRITKYGGKPNFQHIYPVVPTDWAAYRANPRNRNSYIVVDCVTDAFDYEEPFSAHQDTEMNAQVLNGLDGGSTLSTLQVDHSIGSLGRAKRTSTGRGSRRGAAAPVQEAAKAAMEAAPGNPQATATAVATTAAAIVNDSRTNNAGTLKNGDVLQLSEEIDYREAGFTVPYSGSMNGQTVRNKFVLRNGQKTDVSLARFVVVNGTARGVKANGTYYTDFGAGRGFQQIPGAVITNPGVALAGTGDFEEQASLFSLDGDGTLAATPGGRFGLYIPAEAWQNLLAERRKIMGRLGLGGLGEVDNLDTLAGVLHGLSGDMLDQIETYINGFGLNGNLGELGDINGIEGLMGDDALLGVFNASMTNPILPGFERSYIVYDGLGARSKARTARRRGVATPAVTAPVAPAPAAAESAKVPDMGVYIPLNTIQNILRYRKYALNQLQSQGRNVSPGSIGFSLQGLGELADTDADLFAGFAGLGFFKKLMDKVGDAARKLAKSPIISPITKIIPGVGLTADAIKFTENFVPKGGGSNSIQPIASAGSSSPSAQGSSDPTVPSYDTAMANYRKRLQGGITNAEADQAAWSLHPHQANANLDETMTAYTNTAGTNGLDGLANIGTWAKENPVSAGLVGAGVVAAGYYAYKKLLGSGKKKAATNGLGGVKKGKGSKTRKSGGKGGKPVVFATVGIK